MDLVQEGDFFEAEEVSEAEDTPPPEVVPPSDGWSMRRRVGMT